MAVIAFDYIGNEIAINGIYELEELENIFNLLTGFKNDFKNGTACDIGANIGNHSRYLADKFNRVVSFEPNPLITDILKYNTKFFPNITVFDNAIGDFQGSAVISGNRLNIGGFTALRNQNFPNQDSAERGLGSSSVKIFTLDSFLEHLDNLQFIKIDVEGFEMKVINGAAQTIFKFKPIIAFEQWPSDFVDSKSKVIEALIEMGYVFFWQTDYSSSKRRIIKLLYKLIQIVIGIKRTIFNNSTNVPPGHYSLLVAVHNSKISRIK